MTWEDAEAAIEAADVVAVPCGSTEQHSLHLPLSVDTIRADNLTKELARRAPEVDLDVVVAPTLPYGYSEHHMTYPGTITLSAATYQSVVTDVGRSLARHGASRVLFLNGHGGNLEPLRLAADRLQRDHDLPAHVVHWTEYAREQLEARFGDEWLHAGEHETSVVQYYEPDLVREERAEPQTRRHRLRTRRYRYFDETTEQGGFGDPTAADPEFIETVIEETTTRILRALRDDVDSEGYWAE
ncbi:MAG: creatininase family protein [Halorhabdus sp.]